MAGSGRRKVQDDTREVTLARLLELQPSERRIGPDATDENGNTYELKTTTTRGLSTSRVVGQRFLDGLRQSYFVAAKGRQTTYAFAFEEIYFLHPDDLEDWIQGIEDRLRDDLTVVAEALRALEREGADKVKLERLRYIGERGVTLNNPKIPWAYVESHGARLGSTPSADLRRLVAERPLASS